VDDGDGDGDGGAPTEPAYTTTDQGDGSPFDDGSYEEEGSGGVEDTAFGMSDDMPLVADIPEIKQGFLVPGTWVVIQQTRPTSGRASLAGDTWFYVQDPVAEEYMGLRVSLAAGEAMPNEDSWLELTGWVRHDDEQGWNLDLDSTYEYGSPEEVMAQRVRISTLLGESAMAFDDSVVDVTAPLALRVTRLGTEPGTVLVGAIPGSSGALVVDLRPFGLDDNVPPPGTVLSRLRGVAEIGGSRPVILPRTIDDIVVDP
jgi:hypothetical protein